MRESTKGFLTQIAGTAIVVIAAGSGIKKELDYPIDNPKEALDFNEFYLEFFAIVVGLIILFSGFSRLQKSTH